MVLRDAHAEHPVRDGYPQISTMNCPRSSRASESTGRFFRFAFEHELCVVRGLVENVWWQCALVSGLWGCIGLCCGSVKLGYVR